LTADTISKWYETNYAELKTYSVSLDKAPHVIGLRTINEKIALVREYMNITKEIYIQAIKLSSEIKKSQTSAKAYADLQYKHTLATDKEVLATKQGKEDREAISRNKTQQFYDIVDKQERALADADAFLAIVKLTYEDLTATKYDITSQVNVIRQMMLIGEINIRNTTTDI